MNTIVTADPPATPTERMTSLYRLHAAALYHFLLRVTFGDRQAAEDLTQETLLRAWRNIDSLAPNIAAVRPWLFTVARRVAIDSTRARKARPPELALTDETSLADTDDAIDRMLNVHAVRTALAGLPTKRRTVLIEAYFKDRSAAQIAAALNIPEGTVKSRTHHALRALRTAIGPGEAA